MSRTTPQKNKLVHVRVSYAINMNVYNEDCTFVVKAGYPAETLPPKKTILNHVFREAKQKLKERIDAVPFNAKKIKGYKPFRYEMTLPVDIAKVTLLSAKLIDPEG